MWVPNGVCRTHYTTGACPFGIACTYQHPLPSSSNSNSFKPRFGPITNLPPATPTPYKNESENVSTRDWRSTLATRTGPKIGFTPAPTPTAPDVRPSIDAAFPSTKCISRDDVSDGLLCPARFEKTKAHEAIRNACRVVFKIDTPQKVESLLAGVMFSNKNNEQTVSYRGGVNVDVADDVGRRRGGSVACAHH